MKLFVRDVNLRRTSLTELLLIVLITVNSVSCTKDNNSLPHDTSGKDTVALKTPVDFIYNIPIVNDTILMDGKFGIDLRVGISDYDICSVKIQIDGISEFEYSTDIINTSTFSVNEILHKIQFYIKAVKPGTSDTTFFKSDLLFLRVVTDLSANYVKFIKNDGTLYLSWSELDKINTNSYLIERISGANNSKQEFIVTDSIFTDPYYVGEKVDYKISVINHDFLIQRIWNISKQKERPEIYLTQNSGSGYTFRFSKCQYYRNFGEYNILDDEYPDGNLLVNSSNINDTIYQLPDAKFGDGLRIDIEIKPKESPVCVPPLDKEIYRNYFYPRCGIKSFEYDCIDRGPGGNLIFSQNDKMYRLDATSLKIADSTSGENFSFNYFFTTPAGTYFYAPNNDQADPQMLVWETNKLTSSPKYHLETDYLLPAVSDNLIAVQNSRSWTTVSKVTIFDVPSGKILYTTTYEPTGNPLKISSNGQYLFINSSGLKLCRYNDNVFDVIWEESDFSKLYGYYDFNPLNPDKYYLWDNNKNFFINNISDFSIETTFLLDIEKIVNIDFYSGRIMGYKNGNILIIKLSDGSIEKEITANFYELFLCGYKTWLSGNTIFNGRGIKYLIN